MLKEVRNQVEEILKRFPETRSSDKLLEVLVLTTFYKVDRIEDILQEDVPSLESIRRSRQYFHEHNQYLSSKKIAAARQKLEEKYRDVFEDMG